MSSPAPGLTKSPSSPVTITSAPEPPLTTSAPAPVSIVVISLSVKTPPDSSIRTSSAPPPERTEMRLKVVRLNGEPLT